MAKKIKPFNKVFGPLHMAAQTKGQSYRDLFIERVEEFFNDKNHHLYIAGQPGVGKTYTVERIATNYPDCYLLTVKGRMTMWALAKMLAVNLYRLPKDMYLMVYIDDINDMFKANSDMLDAFKIMMSKDDDKFQYNVSLGSQISTAEEFEQEAISYWKSLDPNRTGFVIPFDGRVKFIFTMNMPLPGKQEVDAHPKGSDKWMKLNNIAAARSRVTYENLIMDKETYWGWIADVVWHDSKMCEGATEDQRYEMLTWLWDNWDVASETSLRFVEDKMWVGAMKKYPDIRKCRVRWEKLKG